MFGSAGCKHCDETGYLGRMAIFDILAVTDQLKADIANNKALVADLKTEGHRKDRFNMRKESLRRVAAGQTTLEELKRVVG